MSLKKPLMAVAVLSAGFVVAMNAGVWESRSYGTPLSSEEAAAIRGAGCGPVKLVIKGKCTDAKASTCKYDSWTILGITFYGCTGKCAYACKKLNDNPPGDEYDPAWETTSKNCDKTKRYDCVETVAGVTCGESVANFSWVSCGKFTDYVKKCGT